jgi:hypothetical protein
MEKPKTVKQYEKWLEEEHNVEVSRQTLNYYETVANHVKWTFEDSEFWTTLKADLQEFDDEYRIETGYPLFAPRREPDLLTKPFGSFLLKTFRKNVVYNKNWPEAPTGGWVLPKNWYSRIGDIVRTSLIVKYLDGVEFTIVKLRGLCDECGLSTPRYHLEARQEGYYAAHFYVRDVFEVPAEDWDTVKIETRVEIQIRTQVQDLIRTLLHKYYERRRGEIARPDRNWQWDYESNEFSANYLGHILHYLEGMIMEVRQKQSEEELQ